MQLTTALLVGLVSVIVMLDSRLLGRLNLERPLIGATLVGIVLGDVQTGLAVGATIELMSMGLVDVGAAVSVDMKLGAVIAAAFAIQTGTGAETALTIAVPIAVLGQLLGVLFRSIIAVLSHMADADIEAGKFKQALHLHIVWGTVLYSLMYFVPTFLAIYFGTDLVQQIVNMVPAWLNTGLTVSSKILTAFGLALLLSIMLTNRNMWTFFFLGFLAAAYLKLSVTAVALFSVIIALVLQELKFGRGGGASAATTGGGSAQLPDDYDPLEDDDE